MKLVHHAYSGLFGTFLCNSARDRDVAQLSSNTYSVFAYLRANRDRFTNYLYSNRGKVRRQATACRWKRAVDYGRGMVEGLRSSEKEDGVTLIDMSQLHAWLVSLGCFLIK